MKEPIYVYVAKYVSGCVTEGLFAAMDVQSGGYPYAIECVTRATLFDDEKSATDWASFFPELYVVRLSIFEEEV